MTLIISVVVLGLVAQPVHGAPPAPWNQLSGYWVGAENLDEASRADNIVLLCFDAKEPLSPRVLRKLGRLRRQKGLFFVGLTPDEPRLAERYFRRYRLRFPIGARAKLEPLLGVRELPALIVVSASATSVSDLRSAVGQANSSPAGKRDVEDDEAALRAAGTDRDKLVDFLFSDADGHARCAALDQLFRQMDSDEFLALADDSLTLEGNPWVRGKLRYLSAVARGGPRDEDGFSESADVFRRFIRNRQEPEWAWADAYIEFADEAAPPRLVDEYFTRLTEDPQDTLRRRIITQELWAKGAAARGVLLQILASEPDRSNRMLAAMGLNKVCHVGDAEAVDALLAAAAVEPNDLQTRPMMEYVAFRLRTGNDDANAIPPPPLPSNDERDSEHRRP